MPSSGSARFRARPSEAKLPAVTEDRIIAGCRGGDRAAQRALYELTSERIHRLLIRMLRHPEDAADVMQSTYIRVFEKIDQFKAESGVATWAYRVALNEALQFLRKRRRQEKLGREPALRRVEAVPGGEDRVEMQDALERLPEEERTLLVLKYYEGMNYAEMAAVLEKPAGTIASGLNRARALLRQVLEGGEKPPIPPEDSGGLPHPR